MNVFLSTFAAKLPFQAHCFLSHCWWITNILPHTRGDSGRRRERKKERGEDWNCWKLVIRKPRCHSQYRRALLTKSGKRRKRHPLGNEYVEISALRWLKSQAKATLCMCVSFSSRVIKGQLDRWWIWWRTPWYVKRNWVWNQFTDNCSININRTTATFSSFPLDLNVCIRQPSSISSWFARPPDSLELPCLSPRANCPLQLSIVRTDFIQLAHKQQLSFMMQPFVIISNTDVLLMFEHVGEL